MHTGSRYPIVGILVLIAILALVVGLYVLIPAPKGTPGPTATSTTATSTTATTTPDWEQGMTIVTRDNMDQTVTLTKNERFVIQLGTGLNWTLSFDPALISRVPNTTTADGIQGIYEADATGTTTLHATGVPICKTGEACPQYLVAVTVNFNILADATGMHCGGFIQNAPTCPANYHCQLSVSKPDTGGTCQPD